MRDQARITGSTSLACIVGHPASHSLSPVIHNAAFNALGLDWVYLAFDVTPASLEPAIGGLRSMHVRGINVTMPHKRAVISYVDSVSEDVRAIGAANTIVVRNETLHAENTDGEGFLRFLINDASTQIPGKNILLIGAGGSSRALACSLARAGAQVNVTARRSEQAREVAQIAPASVVEWASRDNAGERADVVINATSIADWSPIETFSPDQVVIDLLYAPLESAFLAKARTAGAITHNGIGMLLHQAGLSFEMWTGQQAPLAAMRESLPRSV